MQTESETQTADDPNYEELALADGWKPEEEWRGPKDRWVDAKTFVERGAQILPLIQAKNRHLVETVEKQGKRIADLEEGSSLFREHHEKTIAREKIEHDRLIKEIEATKAKAITDGDGTTYIQADNRLQELRREAPAEQKPALSADSQAWLSDNPWYNTDTALQALADGLSDHVKRENPTLKGRAFLDKLTERVKVEMPHKFENARRTENVTNEHSRKVPVQKGRTFDDLPDDAKTACARFERTIKGFTKETYLSTYRWDQQ